MESVNGVTDVDKGGPPPPSPLTGCYLLIVVGEPHSELHKDIILQRIAKGLLSWDLNDCLVDLEKELAIITEQALEGEEARYGERLIQFASENLVTEILIHPVVSTLAQCMRNLLSSFTRHRHIIHAGYTFAANGSWALQDGTFSSADFSEAFQELEVQRVIRAYENGISLDLHCSPEGDWNRLPKESFAKACKVRVNPTDVLTTGSPAITEFINYLSPFLLPSSLENLLESSDVVGNIRFSRPTLYVFPGGQGDAALFGINGFNMLLDGGFSRKACFWDFVRHLDRLDAVLMTRLNNSNVGGISSVLRRKKQDAVYPQIGHFFCNIQERKAILSPDGDKDKDPLLINLVEEGQEIISNLRHLNLNPQVCYRDSEPINLYHKVGHGTLDMYVLSPAKDSKEVREFLQKWNQSDQKLFANSKSSREFSFPIQNLISIAALLVWQPANPNDTITRILFPGSSPQKKIFEGLDRLKNLEFIKHPVCTDKSLIPSSLTKKTVKDSIIEKVISKEKVPVEKKENKIIENEMAVNGELKEKIVKKSDSTESERSTRTKKTEDKIIENGEKPKAKPKPAKIRGDLQQKRKIIEKKSSPTTPKKTVENGDVKKPTKPSPIGTPAKSTKDANNRKVIESKTRSAKPPPPETKPKVERKPISRRPKGSIKAPISPVKKLVNGVQKPDSISKKGKLDKEGTTDSSTVSTPSADQDSLLKKDISKLTPEELQQMKAQELADLKEEQEAVKEIEAVFKKGEGQPEKDESLRKVKDVSIDEDKLEKEEYLIIEKEEIDHDSLDEKEPKEDETQKLARDSEESEKQRKLSTEEQFIEKHQDIEQQVNNIVTQAEGIAKSKEEIVEVNKETIITSPEEKIDISSTDKKTTDKEIEEEVKDVIESQPDEKVSGNIKSGDTTTAPTLPEDERIPLDEIKEDSAQIIEEKHVKEETKEKEVPIIQLPPKTFETISKVPAVVGIRLDKQSHIRDIVKTPDEVADLPVHEEVDYEYTHELKAETKTNEVVEEKKVDEKVEEFIKDSEERVGFIKEQAKEIEQEKDKDDVLQEQLKDIIEDVDKTSVLHEELKHLTDTVLDSEIGSVDVLKNTEESIEKEISKFPTEIKQATFDNTDKEIVIDGLIGDKLSDKDLPKEISKDRETQEIEGEQLQTEDILEKAELETKEKLDIKEIEKTEEKDFIEKEKCERGKEEIREVFKQDTEDLKETKGVEEKKIPKKDVKEASEVKQDELRKEDVIVDDDTKQKQLEEVAVSIEKAEEEEKDKKEKLDRKESFEKETLNEIPEVKEEIAISEEKSEQEKKDVKKPTEKEGIHQADSKEIGEKSESKEQKVITDKIELMVEPLVNGEVLEGEKLVEKTEVIEEFETKFDPTDVKQKTDDSTDNYSLLEKKVASENEEKVEAEKREDKQDIQKPISLKEKSQLETEEKEDGKTVDIVPSANDVRTELIKQYEDVIKATKEDKVQLEKIEEKLQQLKEKSPEPKTETIEPKKLEEVSKPIESDPVRATKDDKVEFERLDSKLHELKEGIEIKLETKLDSDTTAEDEDEKDTKLAGDLIEEMELGRKSPKEREEEVIKTELLKEKSRELKADTIEPKKLEKVSKPIESDIVKATKDGKVEFEKLESKLQELKESIEIKLETKLDSNTTVEDEDEKDTKLTGDLIEKMELGRKSPKEREEDVIKIVASVAEVLKSDAPLEEFEGKLPISTFNSYPTPYTTELRETHITTVDSPIVESKSIKTDDIPPIPEEPSSATISFLDEERKIAPLHEPESDKDKRSSLFKESRELMMATSKMISEIKSGKVVETDESDESGIVHRMLVTTSSEDGGEEIEICPVGTITFSKSSESSGRSSPEKSQEFSKKSSIVDTISDSLSTVKQVIELHSEKDSGIDDVKSDTDLESQEKLSPSPDKEVVKTAIKEIERISPFEKSEEIMSQTTVSGKSTPDKDASIKSLASGKSTPDISDLEKSKEITSSFEDLKKLDELSKKDTGTDLVVEEEVLSKEISKVETEVQKDVSKEPVTSQKEVSTEQTVIKEQDTHQNKEILLTDTSKPDTEISEISKKNEEKIVAQDRRDSLLDKIEDTIKEQLETVSDFTKSLFSKNEDETKKVTSDLKQKANEIKEETREGISKSIEKEDDTAKDIKVIEEESIIEKIEDKIKETFEATADLLLGKDDRKVEEESLNEDKKIAANLEQKFVEIKEEAKEEISDIIKKRDKSIDDVKVTEESIIEKIEDKIKETFEAISDSIPSFLEKDDKKTEDTSLIVGHETDDSKSLKETVVDKLQETSKEVLGILPDKVEDTADKVSESLLNKDQLPVVKDIVGDKDNVLESTKVTEEIKKDIVGTSQDVPVTTKDLKSIKPEEDKSKMDSEAVEISAISEIPKTMNATTSLSTDAAKVDQTDTHKVKTDKISDTVEKSESEIIPKVTATGPAQIVPSTESVKITPKEADDTLASPHTEVAIDTTETTPKITKDSAPEVPTDILGKAPDILEKEIKEVLRAEDEIQDHEDIISDKLTEIAKTVVDALDKTPLTEREGSTAVEDTRIVKAPNSLEKRIKEFDSGLEKEEKIAEVEVKVSDSIDTGIVTVKQAEKDTETAKEAVLDKLEETSKAVVASVLDSASDQDSDKEKEATDITDLNDDLTKTVEKEDKDSSVKSTSVVEQSKKRKESIVEQLEEGVRSTFSAITGFGKSLFDKGEKPTEETASKVEHVVDDIKTTTESSVEKIEEDIKSSTATVQGFEKSLLQMDDNTAKDGSISAGIASDLEETDINKDVDEKREVTNEKMDIVKRIPESSTMILDSQADQKDVAPSIIKDTKSSELVPEEKLVPGIKSEDKEKDYSKNKEGVPPIPSETKEDLKDSVTSIKFDDREVPHLPKETESISTQDQLLKSAEIKADTHKENLADVPLEPIFDKIEELVLQKSDLKIEEKIVHAKDSVALDIKDDKSNLVEAKLDLPGEVKDDQFTVTDKKFKDGIDSKSPTVLSGKSTPDDKNFSDIKDSMVENELDIKDDLKDRRTDITDTVEKKDLTGLQSHTKDDEIKSIDLSGHKDEVLSDILHEKDIKRTTELAEKSLQDLKMENKDSRKLTISEIEDIKPSTLVKKSTPEVKEAVEAVDAQLSEVIPITPPIDKSKDLETKETKKNDLCQPTTVILDKEHILECKEDTLEKDTKTDSKLGDIDDKVPVDLSKKSVDELKSETKEVASRVSSDIEDIKSDISDIKVIEARDKNIKDEVMQKSANVITDATFTATDAKSLLNQTDEQDSTPESEKLARAVEDEKLLEKEEKILEKSADDLRETFEVVAGMTDSITFEKCDKPSTEIETMDEKLLKKEEEILEESAESIKEAFEIVSDMSKSVVFDKCEKPPAEVETMDEKLLKEDEILTDESKKPLDMSKDLTFDKCGISTDLEEIDPKLLEQEETAIKKSAEALEETYDTVSKLSKSLSFEKCEQSEKIDPELLEKEEVALMKSAEALEDTYVTVSKLSKSLSFEKCEQSEEIDPKLIEKEETALKKSAEALEEAYDTVSKLSKSLSFEKCEKPEDKVLQKEEKVLEDRAEELKETLESLTDISKSIKFEKCEPVEERRKSVAELLEKSAADLKDTVEAVTDMSKSVIYEKCDKEEHKEKSDSEKEYFDEKSSTDLKAKDTVVKDIVEKVASDIDTKTIEAEMKLPKDIPVSDAPKLIAKASDIKDVIDIVTSDLDTKSIEAELKKSPELLETDNKLQKSSESVDSDSTAVLEKCEKETMEKVTSESKVSKSEMKEDIGATPQSIILESKELKDLDSKETLPSLEKGIIKDDVKKLDSKLDKEEILEPKLEKSTLDTVQQETKKLSVSDVEILLSDAKVSSVDASICPKLGSTKFIEEERRLGVEKKGDIKDDKQKTESKDTEDSCDKAKEFPVTEKISVSIAGPSTTLEKSKDLSDSSIVSEIEKQKELQDTLLHEKHIPGAVTPPTVPVSPNIIEPYSDDIKLTSRTENLIKEMGLRSSTPGSDDFEIVISTQSDISSGQASKMPLDSEKLDSDEEDPLSVTSQVAHSRESSHYDLDEDNKIGTKIDPMCMSFYGALPDDEAVQLSEKHAEPSYLYEITKAKFTSGGPADQKDVHLDQINKNKQLEGESLMSTSFIGELPSASTSDDKKDPIESWGKPLGLPAPPTYLYEITKAKYTAPSVWKRVEEMSFNFHEDGAKNKTYLYEVTKPKYTTQLCEDEDVDLDHINQNEQVQSLMSASFNGDFPSRFSGDKDPIASWGKPLGLPSPAPPTDNKGTPKKERKLPPNVTAKNKLNDDRKRAESPSKYKNKKVNPVYVDLTYVPHHGNSYYSYVDFFKRIRARYYVFSGIEPSRDIYNALLEAKQTWDDKELEVTIIPTYDTDILGYWVAENEELLTKYKIDLSPSASRCTINLQDHETSCSAYRLEF